MEARMTMTDDVLAELKQAINHLYKGAHGTGISTATLELAHLRASQINGCSPCVDSGARQMKSSGETDDRLFAVAAWRETPYFTDAERAALALTESMTRLNDRSDAVPDDIWNDAAAHFDAQELSSLVLWVATTNLFNRVNAALRTPAPQNWG